MNRMWFGLLVLVLVAAFGLTVTWGMARFCQPMTQQLAQASDAALAGDWEEAQALAEKARTRWRQYRPLAATVTDHSPMEEAEALFATLEVYSREGQCLAFAQCCAQLASQLKAMGEEQAIGWVNLL